MQTRIYDERLKLHTETWMTQFDSDLTHACTFTFHQTVGDKILTAEDIWVNWENFCKYLNRSIYKHAAKNHNKSLVILPVLHGEISGTRLHIHAAIGCNDREFSYSELAAVINKAWRVMRWTQNETEIAPYRNAGWINYMLHESVRLDLHSVDLTRCCIPRVLKAKILS